MSIGAGSPRERTSGSPAGRLGSAVPLGRLTVFAKWTQCLPHNEHTEVSQGPECAGLTRRSIECALIRN